MRKGDFAVTLFLFVSKKNLKDEMNKKLTLLVDGVDRAFILLILLTVIVFFAGITPSFSSDDYVHLLNNTKFTSINEVLAVFTEPYGREYRPLVRLSLWLNHLMGDTAIPFKITNLLLHLITTLFIYRILNRLHFSSLAALLGTAVFALHPIHVTSIHFILGRTDLIAAVFYFGTLVLVSGWKDIVTIKDYIAVSLMFIAALFAKEMSITLCLTMFAVVFYNQNLKNTSSFVKVLKKLSPFFAVTLVYVIIRIFMWSKLINDVTVYTDYSVQHLVNNYLSWLFALIYPFDLYLAQDLMLENPIRFFSLVAICLSIALGGLLIFLRQRLFTMYRLFWIWAALIWILVTLLPICGGNPHRWYLYIPSFGLSILMAAAVEASKLNGQKIVLILSGILLAIYSLEDFRLSKVWSKQSELSAIFLKQIEENKLYQKEHIYFANIPFGFKSAYLFTLSSLQEAIQYHFGKSPKIVAVSYVNFDEDIEISSSTDNSAIRFKMTPNHYNFFLLSANERRFNQPETRSKENASITIEGLAKNKKISEYSVSLPKAEQADLYYFDGKKIKSAYDVGL
jgi:protein O-mannosyl-transferase